MAKVRKRKLRWAKSSSPQVVGYKLYWSENDEVGYDSKCVKLGNVTEIVLPDEVSAFKPGEGLIEFGVDQGRDGRVIECGIPAHGDHGLLKTELFQLAVAGCQPGTGTHGMHRFDLMKTGGPYAQGITPDISRDKPFPVIPGQGRLDSIIGAPMGATRAETEFPGWNHPLYHRFYPLSEGPVLLIPIKDGSHDLFKDLRRLFTVIGDVS